LLSAVSISGFRSPKRLRKKVKKAVDGSEGAEYTPRLAERTALAALSRRPMFDIVNGRETRAAVLLAASLTGCTTT